MEARGSERGVAVAERHREEEHQEARQRERRRERRGARPRVRVPHRERVRREQQPRRARREGEEQRGRTKDRETDEHRLAQRQRQIDIGKNSDEYKLYNETFPSGGRRKRRAKTPDKYQVSSKRSFDGQISKWRRQLHAEVGTSQPKAKGESQQPRAARPRRAKAKPRVDPFFA